MADKKPPLKSPQRALADFVEANAVFQHMASPYYGSHRGALMRGDSDPERKASAYEFETSIDQASNTIREMLEPIIVSVTGNPATADPGKEDMPETGQQTFDVAPPSDESVEYPVEQLGAAEFPGSDDLLTMEGGDLTEQIVLPPGPPSEGAAVANLPDPMIPEQAPPSRPVDLPPSQAAAEPRRQGGVPFIDEQGNVEPIRSQAPWIVQPDQSRDGETVEQMFPDIPRPQPPPEYDAVSTSIVNNTFLDNPIRRDPMGVLVSDQWDEGQRSEFQAYKEFTEAVDDYTKKMVEVNRRVAFNIRLHTRQIEYQFNTLYTENPDYDP